MSEVDKTLEKYIDDAVVLQLLKLDDARNGGVFCTAAPNETNPAGLRTTYLIEPGVWNFLSGTV